MMNTIDLFRENPSFLTIFLTFRLIESDSKSFNSLTGSNNNGHSRKNSDTSELSLGQGSGGGEETEEDLWITWGRIVNEWDTYWRKKNQFVRVCSTLFTTFTEVIEYLKFRFHAYFHLL